MYTPIGWGSSSLAKPEKKAGRHFLETVFMPKLTCPFRDQHVSLI
jgi:hypothetical protein